MQYYGQWVLMIQKTRRRTYAVRSKIALLRDGNIEIKKKKSVEN
jgi:hypothetical protein